MRIRDLLYLSRSDRRAVAFLLVLAVAALAGLFLFGDDEPTDGKGSAVSGLEWSGKDGRDKWRAGNSHSSSQTGGYYADIKGRQKRLVSFDPNTADSTTLLGLGLQPWQVRNIYKYRAAGGLYRQPEDFARLYGLTKKQYEELRPYIHISDDYRPSSDYYASQPQQYASPDSQQWHRTAKLQPGEQIDLNAADTTLLMSVPGIGHGFARRIVSYRQALGGFFTEDQLSEIENFPAEAVHYFYVNSGGVRKLNVNKMSLAELKRHPYINYYQAKDIVEYRRQRGFLHSLADLRLMKDFTERDIQRLQPYLEY